MSAYVYIPISELGACVCFNGKVSSNCHVSNIYVGMCNQYISARDDYALMEKLWH